jgi:hypothetical protein
MDSVYRAFLVVTLSAVVVLLLLFPEYLAIILLSWTSIMIISVRFCTRRIDEPKRPLILRFGRLHRLGPSGLNFVVPFAEKISNDVDMSPHVHKFVVSQIHDDQNNPIHMNIELLWRLNPGINEIDEDLKLTLLRDDDQRKTHVEQVITVFARQIVLHHPGKLMNRADTREAIMNALRNAVNEYLQPQGLILESIFWRGSMPAEEVSRAHRETNIAHIRIKGLLEDLHTVQESLPDMSAEQFLAYQTYLEMLKRGMPIPWTTDNSFIHRIPPFSPLPHQKEK